MRRLLNYFIFGAFCLWASTAHAGDYYFDSSVSNYTTCSIGSPCTDFIGTTLDTAGVACGSTINLKRGSTWAGATAEIAALSTSGSDCTGNPIYVQSYGTGALPVLYGAAVTSTGWSLSSSKTSVTVDNTTDTITSTSNGFHDGDEVYFSSGTPPGGLSDATKYYCTSTATNTFKVATTHANALAGTAINITSNGSSVTTYTPTYVQSAAQSQSKLMTVAYNVGGVDKALGYWSGSVNALQKGTFKRSGTTLYVRLHNDEDPSTSSVRIASFAHSFAGDGGRGLLRTTNVEQQAAHIRFRDIRVVGSNGVGFSSSGPDVQDLNIEVVGAGADGHLYYFDSIGSGEDAESDWSYRLQVSYSAAGANGGGGYGQGVTNYGGTYNGYTHFNIYNNFMAGMDNLNADSSKNGIQTTYFRGKIYNNGLARSYPSFDPNWYCDGCHDTLVYGVNVYQGGAGEGTASSARGGMASGSEHASTKPCYNIDILNCSITGVHWEALNTGNTTATNNITGIRWWYDTALAYGGTGGNFDMVFHPGNLSGASGDLSIRHCALYGDNIASIDEFLPTPTGQFAFDYNAYYRRGAGTTLYKVSSTSKTLAQMQSQYSLDTHSVYGNINITTDADDATANVLVTAGSSVIDVGGAETYSWRGWEPATIIADIGTYGVRGSTLASYTEDDVSVSPDAGYHLDYAKFTGTSAVPGSLVASANSTWVFNFTIPDKVSELVYNDKIKITLPTGFSWNSGGTSAMTSSNISGTFSACSAVGQALTCARAADGNSEFPGTYSVTITNVGNTSSTGASGTFTIEGLDSIGTRMTWDNAVPAVTIVAAGGSTSTSVGRFSCGKCSI